MWRPPRARTIPVVAATTANRGLRGRVERFFAEGGPLSRLKPGYRARPEQVRLALAVADTLERDGVLLADAPTGVGKSIGYSVPAIIKGDPVVISTATIALQHQLLGEDLPLLRDALRDFTGGSAELTFGLLKGRGNFLCEARLEDALRTGSLFSGDEDHLGRLASWAAEDATSGDREDLPFRVPRGVWRDVAADAEDCVPKKCPFRQRCFYFARRREVSSAQVLVVNHSLLMANVASDYNAFDMEGRHLILDEAHRVEEAMSEQLGSSITRYRIGYVCRAVTRRAPDLGRFTEAVESGADLFFDALRARGDNPGAGGSTGDGEKPPHFDRLQKALASLAKVLRNHPAEAVNKLAEMVHRLFLDLAAFFGVRRSTHAHAVLPAKGSRNGSGPGGSRRGYPELKSWLVDTGEEFVEYVAGRPGGGATVLASATLAPGGSFEYPRRRLGLGARGPGKVAEFLGEEVFRYDEQALVYAAPDLPEPAAGLAFTDGCAARAERLVEISGGRALVLLTTWRALERFRERFRPEGLAVRFQGEDTPTKLTRWLKETPRAVLVGTRGLSEGIDVAGDALSMLILDKPPFPPPDDKVIEVLCKRAGKGWFREVSVPRAQVALRQGAGRLIRTASDRGVVAVLDPRISRKSWGKSMLRALPPAPVTGSLDDVRAFFERGPGPVARTAAPGTPGS